MRDVFVCDEAADVTIKSITTVSVRGLIKMLPVLTASVNTELHNTSLLTECPPKPHHCEPAVPAISNPEMLQIQAAPAKQKPDILRLIQARAVSNTGNLPVFFSVQQWFPFEGGSLQVSLLGSPVHVYAFAAQAVDEKARHTDAQVTERYSPYTSYSEYTGSTWEYFETILTVLSRVIWDNFETILSMSSATAEILPRYCQHWPYPQYLVHNTSAKYCDGQHVSAASNPETPTLISHRIPVLKQTVFFWNSGFQHNRRRVWPGERANWARGETILQ